MFALLATLLASDVSTPQAAPKLTPEESALLDAREVVVRSTTAEDGSESLLAVIDVDASPKATMAAVLDVVARKDEVSALTGVSLYIDTPTQLGAAYDYSLAGLTGTFHILYDIDAAHGFAHYTLDSSKENGIESAAGSYQVFPRGQGTRLVYRVEIEGGGWTPTWVKKALMARNLPEQVKGMRARAESE